MFVGLFLFGIYFKGFLGQKCWKKNDYDTSNDHLNMISGSVSINVEKAKTTDELEFMAFISKNNDRWVIFSSFFGDDNNNMHIKYNETDQNKIYYEKNNLIIKTFSEENNFHIEIVDIIDRSLEISIALPKLTQQESFYKLKTSCSVNLDEYQYKKEWSCTVNNLNPTINIDLKFNNNNNPENKTLNIEYILGDHKFEYLLDENIHNIPNYYIEFHNEIGSKLQDIKENAWCVSNKTDKNINFYCLTNPGKKIFQVLKLENDWHNVDNTLWLTSQLVLTIDNRLNRFGLSKSMEYYTVASFFSNDSHYEIITSKESCNASNNSNEGFSYVKWPVNNDEFKAGTFAYCNKGEEELLNINYYSREIGPQVLVFETKDPSKDGSFLKSGYKTKMLKRWLEDHYKYLCLY